MGRALHRIAHQPLGTIRLQLREQKIWPLGLVLDAVRVVEFMLLDRLFPRSVMYSLRLAEHSLDELHKRRLTRVGANAEAQRLLGQARSELEFLQPGVLLESLETRLAGLQEMCADVGEALALEYFHSAPWVAWTDAGRNGSLVIEEGEV